MTRWSLWAMAFMLAAVFLGNWLLSFWWSLLLISVCAILVLIFEARWGEKK